MYYVIERNPTPFFVLDSNTGTPKIFDTIGKAANEAMTCQDGVMLDHMLREVPSLFDMSREDVEEALKTINREVLIAILQHHDRDGCHTDAAQIHEYGQPATIDKLHKAFWSYYNEVHYEEIDSILEDTLTIIDIDASNVSFSFMISLDSNIKSTYRDREGNEHIYSVSFTDDYEEEQLAKIFKKKDRKLLDRILELAAKKDAGYFRIINKPADEKLFTEDNHRKLHQEIAKEKEIADQVRPSVAQIEKILQGWYHYCMDEQNGDLREENIGLYIDHLEEKGETLALKVMLTMANGVIESCYANSPDIRVVFYEKDSNLESPTVSMWEVPDDVKMDFYTDFDKYPDVQKELKGRSF